jgi:putative restriction endonuclease
MRFHRDRTQHNMATGLWTQEQIKLAFHLYCQLSYGRIHGRNPEIMALAKVIGRTPSAIAMKMLNLASIDPAITSSGRAGLGNASALDRAVWEEFHADWERLAEECQSLRAQLDPTGVVSVDGTRDDITPEDFTGETQQILTAQRIKQNFFRRAVLSSYQGSCCMSGVSDSRLLIASHIIPWRSDKANRLNPRNGLCLSAIHDRAFDIGLICLEDDFTVMVSDELKRSGDLFVKDVFISLRDRKIKLPERFQPEAKFVAWHRHQIFVDNQIGARKNLCALIQ